jgi:hypothetical protein
VVDDAPTFTALTHHLEPQMTTPINTAAFETWLKETGRTWNHMNTAEKTEAVNEYKRQSNADPAPATIAEMLASSNI